MVVAAVVIVLVSVFIGIPLVKKAGENTDSSFYINDEGAGNVGSVIMRNVANSTVYSPYYGEGIGTIYFDLFIGSSP